MDKQREISTSSREGWFDIVLKLGLIAILVVLSFQILEPFILPAIWGVILAIALYSAFLKLSDRLHGYRKIAAAIITILLLLLFMGPFGILSVGLVENLQDLATQLQSGGFKIMSPPDAIADWPIIGKPLHRIWTLAVTDTGGALEEVAPQLKAIGGWLLNLAANLGGGFFQFLLAIIIAGLVLPNAESGHRAITAFANKVANQKGARFVEMAGATIRNVAWGVMGVALLQAILSGLAFLTVDIPLAGLLAFLVLLLSAVQIGPAIVIVPVIIYVFFTADIFIAVLFTIWIVPVMLLDNILKPILVSRGLDTPMIIIFMGVIGGTLSFGIVGLFIGPVILGIGYRLLVEWISDRSDADG